MTDVKAFKYSKTYSNVKSGFSVKKTMISSLCVYSLQTWELNRGLFKVMWIPYQFNVIFLMVFLKNCFWVSNLSLSSMLHFAALCLRVCCAKE